MENCDDVVVGNSTARTIHDVPEDPCIVIVIIIVIMERLGPLIESTETVTVNVPIMESKLINLLTSIATAHEQSGRRHLQTNHTTNFGSHT